jgi:hypothetical protein
VAKKKKRRRTRAAPGRAARKVKASTRRAIIHAYLSKRARKAARTRKKGPRPPAAPSRAVEAAAVGELVIFEAGPDDSPPAFVDWGQFHPPVQGRWRVRVQQLLGGVVLETEDLEIPEVAGPFDWDAGPVPIQVRNVIRAWHEVVRSRHPERGSESPAVTMLRIALVRG